MNDFSNAKAGDKVLLQYSGWSRTLRICTIEKVGKAHFNLVGSSTKYRVKSGLRAGESYSRECVIPYDVQDWNAYVTEKALERMRYDLRDFKWGDCAAELIAMVHALTHPSTPLESGQRGTPSEKYS